MKEHTYCSKANYIGDKLTQVVNIVDKELVAKQFIQPLVVIGDGANDSGMAKSRIYQLDMVELGK